MATNIATGIIDVQLMGLPDVKRQLDGIPRLLDGVAQSAINIQRQMVKVATDANKNFAAFQKKYSGWSTAQLQQAGVQVPMAGAEAVQAEFRKSMRERVKVGYEAETGKTTLDILDAEERILLQLKAQDQAAGKMNAALERVYETELKRVNLSRQTVQREASAFKGILGQEFGIFKDQATQRKETEDLKKMKEGLDEFRKSQEADTKVGKAFTAQMEAQIATNEKYIAQKDRIAKELLRVGKERDILRAKQASGAAMTVSEKREIEELTRTINSLREKMGRITRQQNSFNQELHAFGTSSRAANFRMQQLSFAAQDFVQVIGQTGFAGALHASANNMSMFVQTLDVASPKLLAFGAFGITAGMMALSEWLKQTRNDMRDFTDSLDRLASRTDAAFGLFKEANDLVGSGRSRSAEAITDSLIDVRAAREKIEDISSSLAFRVEGDDVFTRGMRAKAQGFDTDELIQDYVAKARQAEENFYKTDREIRSEFESLIGRTQSEAVEKLYRRIGLSGEQLESKLKEFSKLQDTINDKSKLINRLLRDAAQSIGPFSSSADRLKSGFEKLERTIAASGQSLPEPFLAAAKDEIAMGVGVEKMTSVESFRQDYAGAIERLTKEMEASISLMKSEGNTKEAIQRKEIEYLDAISSLTKTINRRESQRKSNFQDRLEFVAPGSVSEIDKIRSKLADEANALIDRMRELHPNATEQNFNEEAEKVRVAAKQREADAIADYTRELKNSVAEEANWNNRFASQRSSLLESHKKKADEIRQSGLGPEQQQRLLDQLFRSGKQQMTSLDMQEDKARFGSQFAGRFGGESDLQSQELAIEKQLMDALIAIQGDPYLTGAEKAGRAEIAKESAKEAKFAARENFNKIGLSDPKSLHKQIQMSLKKPKSEKLAEDQLKELQTANEINQDLLDAISALGIGT